ncbi:MAG: FlxA-like family protein [Clostridium sp.]|nr:FlxA-like family protein [Clostridium sp.]
MQIQGVNGAAQGGNMGMEQVSDAYSRKLQKQIADAQKKLQEVSTDDELSSEEKMKKRQELLRKINELNIQLQQHQRELRRKKENEEKGEKENDTKTQKENDIKA